MKRVALFVLAVVACYTPKPRPQPPFEPTSFVVDVQGNGRPVILVPGLGCPGAVWNDTIAHWHGAYQTHVLTLAGFAGVAPMPPHGGSGEASSDAPLAATVKDELAKYIVDRKLDHPIVVGHSMGGFIAYWLAATAPDKVGPVVIVDGAPAFKGAPGEAEPRARQFRDQMLASTQQEWEATTRQIFGTMTGHPDRLAPIVAEVVKSDRKAFANAFYELMTTDLRPLLPKITAPVLVVLADTDYAKDITDMDQVIPRHRIDTLAGTKHFVMTDDPAAFFKRVGEFLTGK
jgi:pimeloyl-ACP methyl ester carboxylesterase